jgi:hypothetical protein
MCECACECAQQHPATNTAGLGDLEYAQRCQARQGEAQGKARQEMLGWCHGGLRPCLVEIGCCHLARSVLFSFFLRGQGKRIACFQTLHSTK